MEHFILDLLGGMLGGALCSAWLPRLRAYFRKPEHRHAGLARYQDHKSK